MNKIFEQYVQERPDLYLPMIQPLQYTKVGRNPKGWEKDGFLAITDLKGCYERGCPQETGSDKK